MGAGLSQRSVVGGMVKWNGKEEGEVWVVWRGVSEGDGEMRGLVLLRDDMVGRI